MNPFRFLPPEYAHQLALFAIKNGLGPQRASDSSDLGVQILGKRFNNPIGLAAGADKKAEALVGWTRMGFGFVEAGTVTLFPRRGNPSPRLWRRRSDHLINWLGLPGDGLEPFITRLQSFQNTPERKTLIVGTSLASPNGSLEELKQIAVACAPLSDYLALNVSCPNISGHDAPNDAIRTAQAQIKAVTGEAGKCPVLVKLGPTRDKSALNMMLESIIAAGAAGIIATNTVPWAQHAMLTQLPFHWPSRRGQPVGGYSGPLLLDIACWMVAQAREILGPNIPIIGCGGIQSGNNAARLFEAGADLIQLYTGLVYKGPGLLNDIKQSCKMRAMTNQDQKQYLAQRSPDRELG